MSGEDRPYQRPPQAQAGAVAPLQSEWDGLNPHLIASFFPLERYLGSDGKTPAWRRVDGSPEVRAPLSDGSVQQVQNWQSPFEQAGPETVLPVLSAMLQTGELSSLINALSRRAPEFAARPLQAPQESADSLFGASGVTKLNATQVYTGSPPLKLSFKAHFRAMKDPIREVTNPARQLVAWSMPQKLATSSVLANVVLDGPGMRTLYPSQAPQIIGIRYADAYFAPMVIESIAWPMTTPRSSGGAAVQLELEMCVASLTAWDAKDWVSSAQPLPSSQEW